MQPRLLWNKVGAGVLALAGEVTPVIAQGALLEGAPIASSRGFAGWAGAL